MAEFRLPKNSIITKKGKTHAAPGASRAEDRVPPGWLNALLFRLLVVPARSRLLGRVPGVSLLAVLRRRPTG